MKKNNNKKQSHKQTLLWGLTCLTTFGVTAAGVFFLLPQQTITNHLSSSNGEGDQKVTPSEKFVNSLLESATSGLGLSINTLDLSIPGAVKSSLPQEDGSVTNTYYDNHISTIPGKPAGIKLALNSLSLSGINLSAELPLAYNGLQRQLNLGLLGDGETEKNLYFNIADIDGNEHDWDAGYQVSVLREVDTSTTDPITGGNPSYEYGRLDFVLHDIIEILTKGGINIDTYGKIGGNDTSDSTGDSSSSGFDTDAMMDALSQMKEGKDASGKPYFTLDLPLGNMTYSIGFGGDENYSLTHIDMPAVQNGKQGRQQLLEGKDWTIQLSADVTTKASVVEFDWTVPAAWKAYPRLDDSLELYRRIASYVATPKFGVSLDVDMEHHVKGEAGTYTTFGKKEVHEKANLHVGGNVDLSWKLTDGAIKGVNFNRANAALSFTHFDANGTKKGSQTLSALIQNTDSDNSGAYLNFGDALKARTTKTTLDELMGKFKSETTADPANPEGSVEEKKTDEQLNQVISTLDKVLKVLQGESDYQKPALLTNLEQKHYEDIVDMIDNVAIADNLISLELNLKPLGFNEAKIVLTLRGDSASSLAKIEIKNLVLQTLTLNVVLETPEFQEPLISEDMLSWGELTHLPTVVDQIKPMIEDKKLGIELQGNINYLGTQDVYKDANKTQGLDLNGRVALDFSGGKGNVEGEETVNPAKIKGTVALNLTERGASYYQDHHLAIDIDNQGEALFSNDNVAYFHYDSKNDPSVMTDETKVAVENRKDPTSSTGINGQIGTNGLDGVIDTVKDLVSNSDDRFARISRLFSSGAEASLMSDISSGNYFAIVDYSFLNSSSFASNKAQFDLNGSAFGMGGSITLSLNFNDDKTLKNLQVETLSGEEGKQTSVDLRIALADLAQDETFASLGEEKKNYDDYSGLYSLIDYAAETTVLGLKEGEGLSTYDLQGTVGLQLGDYETKLVQANMAMSVEGARIKMAGSLNDIPVIRGLNAPDNDLYFRPLELGGSRDASFYYYSDGREDAEGNLTTEMLLTRDSDYGKLANVRDSVKLNKEGAFKEDALNYVLQYVLGVNESYFENNSEGTSSSGLADALHFEDLYKGFSKSVSSDGNNVTYTLKLNLNGLLGVNILDDINLVIGGGTFLAQDGQTKVHALNSLHVDCGVSFHAENTGNRLSLAKASVDLVLANLDNGVYSNGWDSVSEAYSTNFLSFSGDEYQAIGIYAEPTDKEGGKAWRHGVDEANKGHRNYYLSK